MIDCGLVLSGAYKLQLAGKYANAYHILSMISFPRHPVIVSSHRWANQALRQILILSVALNACLLVGCSFVDTESDVLTRKSLLNPIQPGMNAVQLDIIYVERDVDDPLLASLVWNEVDMVGTVDLETRSKLRESGFRLGMVGLTPPRSLQRLLGIQHDLTDAASTSRHQGMVGRSLYLRSGGETEILTSRVRPEITITLPGETEPTKLFSARSVLRTELERLQDGWVKLHITPEIHHGSSLLRPVAGVSQWELKGQQKIISFRDLKFSVTLNIGEMLLVSTESPLPDNIANQFFVDRDEQRPQRRMVVIRLTDMKKIEPLYED